MNDFQPSYSEYFDRLWGSYGNGGIEGIASYLHGLDVSGFNPKAPPPKTDAFHEIVMASRNWEANDLGDVLNRFGNPAIVTLDDLCDMTVVDEQTIEWIKDRRNRRVMPRWFEACDYIIVKNHTHKQGLWHIKGKQQMVYGRKDLGHKELNMLAGMKAKGM
jgi:hypothetical protein